MLSRIAPLAIAAALLTGCALTSHPRIADIRDNPGRYQNRSVTVDGVVTTSWGVPMLPLKLYKVDDGTGEVTIVSHHERTPSRGARVSVRGRVNEIATIAGQAVGLHLEEEHVRFKY